MLNKRITALTAGVAIAGLALVGCSAPEDNGGGTTPPDGNGSSAPIQLAVFNGWDEGIAVSELWKAILEGKGYEVELLPADPAPVFFGLQSGDYDLTMDVWLPGTHASYLEEYGDDIVELGAWNTESKLTIAVNEDSPITSLAELAENAEAFRNQLIGIEPGAGLTEATLDRVIPTYGLEGMDYITSSTGAMLAELETAINAGENVVVTLWEPHWAYGAYPIRNLEDPEGTLADIESIYTYSRIGFADDYPEVAAWLSNFTMDLDTLYSLENAMFVEYDGSNYGPIVAEWIAANQDYVDSLTQ